MRPTQTLALAAVSGLLLSGTTAAQAGPRDHDRDGIPTRWERSHGLDPFHAADARADWDKDGLRNRGEYRFRGFLRDEDTDNDGHDDGDEVHDDRRSTHLRDADTDDDRKRDGDEDADRDGVRNEDEDDARESCARDDDDRDGDDVADEDENELHLARGDRDSDDDDVTDGEEDRNRDGRANEDEDDHASDACSSDRDGNGEDDEDEDDLLGVIASFDSATGLLTVTARSGYTVTGVVTDDTEIEFEDVDDDDRSSDDEYDDSEEREASPADLREGVRVAELDFDDETAALEEVEIYLH